MKKISDIIEDAIKSELEKEVTRHWDETYHRKCEVCGDMSLFKDMETILVDEDRTPALVCHRCYFVSSEKDYDILPGEYENNDPEPSDDDPKESALNDIAQGKW